MDRAEWLREKRRLAEERMDVLFAPIYDAEWGASIDQTHERFVRRFLELTPQGSAVLDAACGTGKYWPLLEDRSVTGTDQSKGMLARAGWKMPDVPVIKVGLQELEFESTFDGVLCIDAMENVPPEDWPLVLANLCRALRPHGILYLTVEVADPAELSKAATEGRRLGLPLVDGEVGHEGYHYYPPIPQVRLWIEQASLETVEEAEGDGYWHLVCQKHEAG